MTREWLTSAILYRPSVLPFKPMKILIISDIHANLTALDAVLEAVNQDFEATWCLGDLVGYGPDPNECIERVRELPDLTCLFGNHDQAALGKIPLERFNQDARAAASWTQQELTDESEAYLLSLPSRVEIAEDFTLAHGSPRQPVWEYILDLPTAEANFEAFQTSYCLVGHSHIPLIFSKQVGKELRPVQVRWDEAFELSPRMILKPGSVGQPRDMDPRAAYAVLDTEDRTWTAHRVAYDVEAVQERMLEAGLPERQAIRLGAGW